MAIRGKKSVCDIVSEYKELKQSRIYSILSVKKDDDYDRLMEIYRKAGIIMIINKAMRIITPLGKLCVVKKAVPLVSKQFEFNSSDRFLCEVCKEEGIANGIALDIGDKDSYGLCYDLVICNLPYEKVNDIFYHLLVDGWYDFGVWEYQNVEFFTELKFGENSLPYTSEITMLGNPVFCKPKGLSHDELDEC